ncbi:MAG: SH3 domain-containing protein [Rhodocyclaceae bacterium]
MTNKSGQPAISGGIVAAIQSRAWSVFARRARIERPNGEASSPAGRSAIIQTIRRLIRRLVARLAHARVPALVGLMLALTGLPAAAELVTPSERVRQDVDVRTMPSVQGNSIARLRPGETATLLERVPYWYKVRLTDGREGFVSKSWSTVLPDAPGPAALAAKQTDELRIHFFNTGAGTCTMVECPGNGTRPIVVDCGSFPGSRDQNALSDADVKARFQEILSRYPAPDVVLSHGDLDHFNLIPVVLEGVTVNEIWQGDNDESYDATLRAWMSDQVTRGAKRQHSFPRNWHNAGQPITNGLQCGPATASVLTVNSGGSDNANSLVLMIEYDDFSVIFTGDAEGTTEANAMQNFSGNIKATLLTGSHHGANTKDSNSSAWAQATLPTVTVYSSGTKYGHPRCLAKDRLSPALASVEAHDAICGTSNDDFKRYTSKRAEYMTRVNGTITATTNGRSPLRLRCEIGPGCDVRISY